MTDEGHTPLDGYVNKQKKTHLRLEKSKINCWKAYPCSTSNFFMRLWSIFRKCMGCIIERWFMTFYGWNWMVLTALRATHLSLKIEISSLIGKPCTWTESKSINTFFFQICFLFNFFLFNALLLLAFHITYFFIIYMYIYFIWWIK